MRRLDYQEKVLDTLDVYLERLKTEKVKADSVAKLAAENPGLDLPLPDFTEKAWDAMRQEGRLPASRMDKPFSARMDGCNRPVPNVTLKVPTGGGKTWIAVNAVSRVLGRYNASHTGFVLWIVPNEAIYTQTLKAFRNRDHPYRQAFDRAAAGRVKVMEKGDRLDARDVAANLCVMVLMLQSANRQTKETLKMFRDRGDVHGFTPDEGDQDKHEKLLDAIPNLEIYDLAHGAPGTMVKDSLGNALRIIRPIVVMDEGHKAVSDLAYSTLYGFNPVFVLELSATPKDVKERFGDNPRPARYANVLSEITGIELDREGMIKMPLNLETHEGSDWKATLDHALERLNSLQKAASRFEGNTKRYIRPILLVQVERTGKDQRGSEHIHSEDVKKRLLTLGFADDEIAVKTAEKNDLNQPENQDLLSPANRVRVIITKSALQEGWDCPFAYVLCSLAASSNMNAMTQLVGRILRQPHAMKTGENALDECYVVSHHAQTADVVNKIKSGLEKDGLGDLVMTVSGEGANAVSSVSRKIPRREQFRDTRIWLPLVLARDGKTMRDFDYETDLLARLDWTGFDPAAIADSIPENAESARTQMQRISLVEGDERISSEILQTESESENFDPAYAVRSLSDLVPNPFVCREIVQGVLTRLQERGFSKTLIGEIGGVILDTMRQHLSDEQLIRAETQFKQAVQAGDIQFRLRTDGKNWVMPKSILTERPAGDPPLLGKDAQGVRHSLFADMYRADLNQEERDVAGYLDADKALIWWHRNVARRQYGLSGWRRGLIYPDFIFASQKNDAGSRIVVLETKGDHLENDDTAYKRDLLQLLSENFDWDNSIDAGKMEVVSSSGDTVECTLILMKDIKTQLPEYLK